MKSAPREGGGKVGRCPAEKEGGGHRRSSTGGKKERKRGRSPYMGEKEE